MDAEFSGIPRGGALFSAIRRLRAEGMTYSEIAFAAKVLCELLGDRESHGAASAGLGIDTKDYWEGFLNSTLFRARAK